jgi:hypothetical protein
MRRMPVNYRTLIFIAAALALGGVGGSYFAEGRGAFCARQYEFVNTAIVCEYPPTIQKTGYVDTYAEITRYVEAEKAAGHITDFAFYFRDLYGGPVFGINETADFAPASLLKVPLALVYLSWAEREPDVLGRRVVYTSQKLDLEQEFKPDSEVAVGEEHSVEELLRSMLIHSDNSAYEALITYLEETGEIDRLLETFNEVGIIGAEQLPEDIISVRRYAGLFRILYNVSYLNAELSEKMLSWMIEAQFDEGLAGGLPANISLANKFGEREQEDGTIQLHDCGIVYFPGNPYLICIMTRGDNLDELADVIKTVSRMMYEEIDSRKL